MHIIGHFKTITRHKLMVMKYCFRVGLIKQGLLHDLSKYSPAEFFVGAKYYTGKRSPNVGERDAKGYSEAWLHHKGRNKHHLEYWIDYGGPKMEIMGHPMPTRYMVELCLDRIAACRVYNGDAYTQADPINYFNRSNDAKMLNPATKAQVAKILNMLAMQGEETTIAYLRELIEEDRKTRKQQPRLPAKLSTVAEKSTILPKEEICDIANTIPTPFYLYSENEIRSVSDAVRKAFAWNPGFRQFFPMKATPNIAILRILKECGQGVVCSSAAELALCKEAGFSGDEIQFLPNYPRDEDIAAASGLGCGIILDGPAQLAQFLRFGICPETIGVRLVYEGPFRFGTSEARMDGFKFGMSLEQLKALIPDIQKAGIKKIGLHAYLSGNTMEPEYYPELTRFLCKCASQLNERIPVAYLNISGGMGIPYRPEQSPVNLQDAANRVRKVMEQELPESLYKTISLYTELGRYVTGPSAMLVTKVTSIKYGSRKFAGVDASASDLMRPMMYGAYHHVSVCSDTTGRSYGKWDVVGAVCENTDKFAENRDLPDLQNGDIIAIHDVGAHGHSMGYNYGGRLRCAEYLYTTDCKLKLIRRAETIEDYLATQTDLY